MSSLLIFEDYYGTQRGHNTALDESTVLTVNSPSSCSYQITLPSLLTTNLLSSSQLDAVGLCCEQHEKVFNDVRSGFLLGDGTGVGKSRIISGIYLENYWCGRRKCLWVTVNQVVASASESEFHVLQEAVLPEAAPMMTITTYQTLVKKYYSFKEFLGSRLFDGLVSRRMYCFFRHYFTSYFSLPDCVR